VLLSLHATRTSAVPTPIRKRVVVGTRCLRVANQQKKQDFGRSSVRTFSWCTVVVKEAGPAVAKVGTYFADARTIRRSRVN